MFHKLLKDCLYVDITYTQELIPQTWVIITKFEPHRELPNFFLQMKKN